MPPSISAGNPNDPYQPAPGALADERSDVALAEQPGHRIAARAGIFVDDHGLGPEDRFLRSGEGLSGARHEEIRERPAEIVDDVIGDLAAAIETLIDNRAFLADSARNSSD